MPLLLKTSRVFTLYLLKAHQALCGWPPSASLTCLLPYQVPATLTFSCFPHQDFCSCYSLFLGRSSSQAACLRSQVTCPLLGRSSPSQLSLLPPRLGDTTISLIAYITISKHRAYLFVWWVVARTPHTRCKHLEGVYCCVPE